MLDASTAPGPIRITSASESADGIERWVVTRHADVAAMSDPRLSNERAYAAVGLGEPGTGDQAHDAGDLSHSMIAADPPDHTRLRKLVVRAFSAKRIEALRPRVQQIADELLDGVADRDPVDLVAAFAFPLPVRVISELLGVPDDVRDGLLRLVSASGEPVGMVPMDAVHAAMLELIDARRAHPAADLLGTLGTAYQEGQLSDTELVQMATMLFGAGHVTTVHLISNGVVTLLQHPEQRAEVRGDPALASPAVDELLRHAGPVAAVPRYALENIEIGGTVIPAGSHVTVALVTANHDPDRFADPDGFDLHRNGGADVAFGHGIHFCLGARLAKLEAEVALGTLLRRFPDLALADPEGEGQPVPIQLGAQRAVRVHLHGPPASA